MRYQEFIDSIRESRENKYFENSECHHILPRCLGGRDDPENLIYLTYEEHFIAHKLLHEENPNNRDLAYAIAVMSKHGELDSKEYASVKKTLAEAWSGKNNPNYGNHNPLPEEHLKNLRENHVRGESHPYYGKSLSEEHRRKISETRISNGSSKGPNNPMYGVHRYGEASPHYSHIHSEETKLKIRDAALSRDHDLIEKFAKINVGRKASEETRKKLSESKRGKKMPHREYELVCRKCGSTHIATSPSVKLCNACKGVD